MRIFYYLDSKSLDKYNKKTISGLIIFLKYFKDKNFAYFLVDSEKKLEKIRSDLAKDKNVQNLQILFDEFLRNIQDNIVKIKDLYNSDFIKEASKHNLIDQFFYSKDLDSLVDDNSLDEKIKKSRDKDNEFKGGYKLTEDNIKDFKNLIFRVILGASKLEIYEPFFYNTFWDNKELKNCRSKEHIPMLKNLFLKNNKKIEILQRFNNCLKVIIETINKNIKLTKIDTFDIEIHFGNWYSRYHYRSNESIEKDLKMKEVIDDILLDNNEKKNLIKTYIVNNDKTSSNYLGIRCIGTNDGFFISSDKGLDSILTGRAWLTITPKNQAKEEVIEYKKRILSSLTI